MDKADFGVCQKCGEVSGGLNVGRGHWFYCSTHRLKWLAGYNLFSHWRDETEQEQRVAYDAVGLGEFSKVEPE